MLWEPRTSQTRTSGVRGLPALRTGRHGLGLVAYGNRLYAIGGGQYALSVSSANEYLTVP